MKRIAIIGASYLQLPLICKAKEMGLETHVFAWAANDVGEKEADYFYPISIVEKEQILDKCRELGISGVCSISSDLAMVTVNYVAHELGLNSNSPSATYVSTNKHLMRDRFDSCGDPSPRSMLVKSLLDLEGVELNYPLIVKPTDRSGSRGVTKIFSYKQLDGAIKEAEEQSFEKKALVEEYAEGQQYSVEYISWHGEHYFLAITKKYTTGAPHFVETAHMQPASLSDGMIEKVKSVVTHALDSLQLTDGASHTELKIDDAGNILIIEIGGRMGGDCIGSSLVQLSTGVDFVKAVIEVALGEKPQHIRPFKNEAAGVRFVFDQRDLDCLEKLKKEHPEWLVEEKVKKPDSREILDSSARFGYYVFTAPTVKSLEQYLP